MLVLLSELVADELHRLDVAVKRRKGFYDAGRGSLATLREHSRELDLSRSPLVDIDAGTRPGRIRAGLDRSVIVEYQDASREVVGLRRAQVVAEQIRVL
jgi:hypothetical protein